MLGNMSSIIHPESSNTAKNDSAETINPGTNPSTEVNPSEASVAPGVAIESFGEKKNMLHSNATIKCVDNKSKIEKSDTESSKRLQDNYTGDENAETKKKENECDNGCGTVSPEDNPQVKYTNKRIAKRFRVASTNKMHEGGKVKKIFFGTVEKLIPGKVKRWRILYDDGDVDIMPRSDLLDAIRCYEINRKYDTNQAHKKPISPLLQEYEEQNEKDRIHTAYNFTSKKHDNNMNTKHTLPKRGKKTKAKAIRKEEAPDWEGPPDEVLDGGWPKGWVKKVFARKNGATKGVKDRYWYSPKEKFKLRSMVQVKKFLKALADTKGDEIKAKETMSMY